MLLAHMSEAEVRRIAAETGLPKLTAITLTQVDLLLERLAEIRKRGYSVDVGESEEGLTGLAAPVHSPTGAVAAALVIAGPAERILADKARRWAPVVVAAADDVSAALADPVH
jgi:IclR family acetate operon transcriptional repressor